MTDDCRHGQVHYNYHHNHAEFAEGINHTYVKKLKWVMVLATLYLVLEAAGSYFSGSLALLADAGHKLADIAAISLALFAAWFSSLSTSPRKTFGFYRTEILAALINSSALIIM